MSAQPFRVREPGERRNGCARRAQRPVHAIVAGRISSTRAGLWTDPSIALMLEATHNQLSPCTRVRVGVGDPKRRNFGIGHDDLQRGR